MVQYRKIIFYAIKIVTTKKIFYLLYYNYYYFFLEFIKCSSRYLILESLILQQLSCTIIDN